MKQRMVVAAALVLIATSADATTAAPSAKPTRAPTRRVRGDLGTKEIHGRIYDALRGPSAGVSGASITYVHYARYLPDSAGSLTADATGAFSFTLFLHDTDTINLRVAAPGQGFRPQRIEYGGLWLWWTASLDIGLQPGFCAGDCDENGSVAINEVIRGVSIALTARPPVSCAALDADINGAVAIDELVAAVDNGLHGCVAGRATSTRTPTPAETPSPCGDPIVMERFGRCVRSETEAECSGAGGRWGRYPFSGMPGCFCPTGQAGCRCTRASDCLGQCYTPYYDGECALAQEGVCSAEEPEGGCWCAFGEDRRASGICSDP